MRTQTAAAAARTEKVLAAIRAYIATWGIPPTIREIREETGLSSTSVVSFHVHRLAHDGRIRLVRPNGVITNRNIVLVDEEQE